MNRLQQLGKAAGPTLSVQVEMASLTKGTRRDVPHALFAPMHYEPNYAYPLVVWLHGPNDDERQLQRIMPLLSLRNYVAVGPRGNVAAPNGRPGFRWSDSIEPAPEAEHHVFEAIDAAKARYHIAEQRIFLAGLENGGSLAYRVAAQHPGRFAGVLSVGGELPVTGSPRARLTNLRDTPLFIAQGRDSERYPVDQLCTDLRLMHSAGLSITVRQYPCGDELNTQILHDMDVWMMEIVTGTPASARPPVIPSTDLN